MDYATRRRLFDSARREQRPEFSQKVQSKMDRKAAQRLTAAEAVKEIMGFAGGGPGKSKYDHAANLTFFLLHVKGDQNASWAGSMAAADQRALFGRVLGKGTIIINGKAQTIEHDRKVAFGTDYDTTHSLRWSDLDKPDLNWSQRS